MDEPLEEVGDVEGNSRVLLNFVESDGLSRVRVCHVGFTPFTRNWRPNEFLAGRHGKLGREPESLFGRDSGKGAGYWQTWVY